MHLGPNTQLVPPGWKPTHVSTGPRTCNPGSKLKPEHCPTENFYSCSAAHAFNNVFATANQLKFSRYPLIHKARGYIPLNRKLRGEERG